MDDQPQAADSPTPSPVRGRGFGRGKILAARGLSKRMARKPAPKRGGRGKGRGRHKTYDDLRVQAAYERQKELRDLYSEVTSAAKPALEKLAEYSINQMIEDPTHHEEVAEFKEVQQQLDERLQRTINDANSVLSKEIAITENQRHLDLSFTENSYHDGFNYVTEDFYAGALNRTSILAELRRECVGVDIPDCRYWYVEQPDEVATSQGPHVVFRNGVEVPEPSRLPDYKTSNIRTQVRKPRTGPKRKTDDLPDGQLDSKKHTAAGSALGQGSRLGLARDDVDIKGDGALTPRPRHIGGLLSAETELDAERESNAPSPSPAEEDQSPESDQKRESVSKKDLPDLPAGASEPDAHGVRTVSKRGPKANNRIIVPPQFEFDDEDIGFRDSTNDSSRKATKTTRGKLLNKPNSRSWHLDATIAYYNVFDYEEGDLDPDIVKKHNLHPQYGFFLPDSVNESETAKDLVDGTRPIVVVTPNGSTLMASRSVRAKVMDEALECDSKKEQLACILEQFTDMTHISVDEITTEEMRDRERAIEKLATEPLEEEPSAVYTPSTEGSDWKAALIAPANISSREDEIIAADNMSSILKAAAAIDAEPVEAAVADRPQPPVSSQRASRPYDAVRDVFASHPSPTPSSSTPAPPHVVDTIGLSVLADVSETHDLFRSHVGSQIESSYTEPASMIDPRLLGGAQQGPAAAAPSNNAFLQTALNHPGQASFAHIAPAPPANADTRPQTPGARVPFTVQGNSKDNQLLPPLRPSSGRRDKAPSMEVSQGPPGPPPQHAQQQPPPAPPASVPPQEFGSPRGMLQTNTGSFYPPAPHRPFHQSYSVHEQGPMMPMSMQQGSQIPQVPHMQPLPSMQQGPPVQQGPPMSGPGPVMMHNPPTPSLTPYPALSPPMQTQPQLAPMPPQMGPSPPLPSQGPPSVALSPPAHTPRHRASIPSNGQNSGKYRKIAAAPIPHNRPWPSNGGSELRLSNYDPKGAIKDYVASEPAPRSGPTTIRGWSVNNVNKGRNRAKKEGSAEETESPK
ncbi:uncharacterized protein BCR38DRAFT_99239 [Pseudomassariella vexata]|uniref:Uncharacterized protein n=1 Tax=Pseudomassariella vexata TaxID=1141098 RepID=A0A1Y2EEU5_9PEZI|nr:uncharacterized protein BCR38DRAFT_99239 [Pseudomassariella vexata]ORY70080.1 hypothetical protein BCR38DRAFT_99239 [Pseudomassariella vexata]